MIALCCKRMFCCLRRPLPPAISPLFAERQLTPPRIAYLRRAATFKMLQPPDAALSPSPLRFLFTLMSHAVIAYVRCRFRFSATPATPPMSLMSLPYATYYLFASCDVAATLYMPLRFLRRHYASYAAATPALPLARALLLAPKRRCRCFAAVVAYGAC